MNFDLKIVAFPSHRLQKKFNKMYLKNSGNRKKLKYKYKFRKQLKFFELAKEKIRELQILFSKGPIQVQVRVLRCRQVELHHDHQVRHQGVHKLSQEELQVVSIFTIFFNLLQKRSSYLFGKIPKHSTQPSFYQNTFPVVEAVKNIKKS